MRVKGTTSFLGVCLYFGAVFLTPTLQASVIPVGPGAFPASATLLTFAGLASSTEVNGLTVGGVLFNYSLGNGNVQIDGGPGITNNVNPPNVVSTGDPSGILTLTLPTSSSLFGYGYALLAGSAISNATTINLFSGVNNVGTLSFNGVPDPTFTGGFAGIQSTVPFNTVKLTFNSAAASAFALDNVMFAPAAAATPEPSAILLFMGGAVTLICFRRGKLR